MPRDQSMDHLLQELDGAFLTGVAAVAWQFHSALLSQGFTEDQALTLTRDWLTSYLEALREPTRAGSPPGPS